MAPVASNSPDILHSLLVVAASTDFDIHIQAILNLMFVLRMGLRPLSLERPQFPPVLDSWIEEKLFADPVVRWKLQDSARLDIGPSVSDSLPQLQPQPVESSHVTYSLS